MIQGREEKRDREAKRVKSYLSSFARERSAGVRGRGLVSGRGLSTDFIEIAKYRYGNGANGKEISLGASSRRPHRRRGPSSSPSNTKAVADMYQMSHRGISAQMSPVYGDGTNKNAHEKYKQLTYLDFPSAIHKYPVFV